MAALQPLEVAGAIADPAIVHLSIVQLPEGSVLPKNAIDWTERFGGSAGAVSTDRFCFSFLRDPYPHCCPLITKI